MQPARDKQGTSRGAADSIRACARCRKNASEGVLLANHDCLLYVISIGKDPRQYANTKAVYCMLSRVSAIADEIQQAHTQAWAAGMALLPTIEPPQEQVAPKKKKSVMEWSCMHMTLMGNWQAKEAQISVLLVQSLFRACCMGNLQPVPIA